MYFKPGIYSNTVWPNSSIDEILKTLETRQPCKWPKNWAYWDNVTAAHKLLLQNTLKTNIELPNCGEGRGIVTCGGGTKYFPSLYVLIHRLRQVGCKLPVELWYMGPNEMDPGMKRLLVDLNVTFVDAYEVQKAIPTRMLGGWELKPYAILYSRFKEVMFIDADSVPLVDPTYLFDDIKYKETGALFFPDFCTWTVHNYVWPLFDLPQPNIIEQPVPKERVSETYGRPFPEGHDAPVESGQLIIDKGRCSKELKLAHWICDHSDYYFWHFHGDKEAFRIAWKMYKTPYAMPCYTPNFTEHTIYQHDHNGEVVFLHRTLDKFKLDGTNKHSAVPTEKEMFALLEDLKSKWGGTPWFNYQPTTIEQVLIEELNSSNILYNKIGHESRLIELAPNFKCGQGRAGYEWTWGFFVEDGKSYLSLSGLQPTCICKLDSDGVFRGRWEYDEKCPVDITPQGKIIIPASKPDIPKVKDTLTKITNTCTRVAVVIPVVLQNMTMIQMTSNAIMSIKSNTNITVYLAVNKVMKNFDIAHFAKGLSEACKFNVVAFNTNTSVAGAWNYGCKKAITENVDYIMIMGNDVTLRIDTIDKLVKYGQENGDVDLWSATQDNEASKVKDFRTEGCDFSCCMLRKRTIKKYGWFDANFSPAYYEDNDYYARVILGGGKAIQLHDVVFKHERSATINNDKDAQQDVLANWAKNLDYFKSKWGVVEPAQSDDIIRSKYNKTPFKPKLVSLTWWEGTPELP